MSRRRGPRCPVAELTLGLALHALEPAEEAAVLGHLPDCSECREVVREAEQTATLLGLSTEQHDPPRALRDRLLAAVRITRPRKPERDEHAVPRRWGPPSSEEPPTVPVRVRPEPVPAAPLPTAQPVSWHRRVAMLAAAAVVLLLSVAGLTARTVQLQQQRDAEAGQLHQLSQVIAGVNDPGSRHAVLTTAAGRPAAVVLDDGHRRAVVPVSLPQNDAATTTYVLWGTTGAAPVPLGTFDVSADRADQVAVRPVSTAAPFQGYAVSLEPGRTLPTAPSQVVATGQIVG